MKLLLDENISFKLCKRLDDIYPGSTHVVLSNLDSKSDTEIWVYAKHEDYVIVTQDSDFNDLSTMNGFPPYVIWLKTGNSRVSDIEHCLREHSIRIRDFFSNNTCGVIEIEQK
jgi:predicted nuclease of predicted toxin-antitoxin system